MRSIAPSVILALLSLTQASPLRVLLPREVPQEHSHNAILASVRASLALNNPSNIKDPVFGLLGNAAAAAGQGSITNTDCLHQATADQAFSNAKVAGDAAGMTNALIYAALERNTGKVGLASVSCTALKATNKEIGALGQHQDPASANAAATNKAITLTLAQQIASVGGDPQEAVKAGTFAPGNLNDATGKGKSCDKADDEQGCIFTQNLLVPDATAQEINAAVAGSSASSPAKAVISSASGTAAVAAAIFTSTSTSTSTSTDSGTAAAVNAPFTNSSAPSSSASSSGTNIQRFTGTLGGPPPPVATSASSARPFSVNGATFVNAAAALQRSCALQHNTCADAANASQLKGGVGQCDKQEEECNRAGKRKGKNLGKAGKQEERERGGVEAEFGSEKRRMRERRQL